MKDKTMEKHDYWELGNFVERTCDNCKWEGQALEELPGDGYAPCRRCTRDEGR